VNSTKLTSVQYLKLGLIGLALLFLFSPRYLHAQGCAMCYQSAAASGARFIHALKSGIVVIVIPPLLMTGIFARFVYRRRNMFHEEIVEHREVSPLSGASGFCRNR
jgi:hypothetical protein